MNGIQEVVGSIPIGSTNPSLVAAGGDLRRLRLHGLIERRAKSHRYQVTELGFRAALFLTRSYARLLRPGMASLTSDSLPAPVPLRRALQAVDAAIDKAWQQQGVAA